MNKKGFTLVELLAVIILLFLIITFALPQITNSVNNNRKKTDELTLEMIKSAAKLYVSDNQSEFPKVNGNVYYLPLTELVEEDYLNENIQYNGVNIKNTKRVTVVYDNGFEYYVTNLKTCTLVEGPAKTIGSKYKCEVKEGVLYIFYVLSDNNDGTYNLIMDRNVYYDEATNTRGLTDASHAGLVAWINQEDYEAVGGTNYGEYGNNNKGPITAMDYLENATSTWTNLENLNITYNDEGGNFTNFPITGKARLPYNSEVSDYDGTNGYLYEYMDEESGISSGDKSISGIYGYWTLSSEAGKSRNAWFVYCGGVAPSDFVVIEADYGVRPVINVKL